MEFALNKHDVTIDRVAFNGINLTEEQRIFLQNQYLKYYDKICLFIRSKGLKNDDVDTIASNVFMKVMENLSTFQDRGNSFGSWIFKIASNEVSQTYRDLKKHRIEELTDDNLLLEEQDFSLGENNVNLYSALKKLTDKQLVIIKLRYFEKISFKEIASILNIKESNAKVKCFRAIEKLRLIYYTIE